MKIAGMETDELSVRDLKEEAADMSRELNAICDYKEGLITLSELQREVICSPNDLERIGRDLNDLREEIKRRSEAGQYSPII